MPRCRAKPAGRSLLNFDARRPVTSLSRTGSSSLARTTQAHCLALASVSRAEVLTRKLARGDTVLMHNAGCCGFTLDTASPLCHPLICQPQ
jgi:hypothetical protein